MISAVVPPQVLASGSLPQPSTVRERAAAGYFRDIALWLNQPLAPHGIFVQVQADRPGCLQLTVEFHRPPIKDHLLRFLCHRVWLLNSGLIEGICVVARPLGHRRVLWQQRIKIVTPALKQRRALRPQQPQPSQGSPLPPQLRSPRVMAGLSRQRLQTLRTFVLSGSAVAAFVMGCLLEAILSAPSPSLPQVTAKTEVRSRVQPTQPDPSPSVQRSPEVSDRGGVPAIARQTPAPATTVANRPTVVDAALEPVGVITHQTPASSPIDEVTLLFGGDITLEDVVPDSLEVPGGFFADIADYDQADLALVNLATPLTNAATNLNEGLRHQTRTDAVNLLVNSGVDIVNLTHSRLMDYGAAGLDETLTTLDSKGLYRIGAGRNAMEARRPEVIDVKGKRIAYLSYAMGGSDAAHDVAVLKERAGADDAAIAKEVEKFKTATAFKDRAGFNAQDMPEIVADIQALRSEVDWIVVNFRWVDHLNDQPNFMQTNLARLAIDQGADMVVGYHPTVIQGGEIYKGRPIAYSLGDFVFHSDEPIENQDSAMLKIGLKDDQMQVELLPVRVQDSRPKTLTGDAGQAVLERVERASAQFEQPLKSPLVLDLKAPEPSAETMSDPSSPFVSPEAEDTLEIKVDPDSETPPASSSEVLPDDLSSPVETENSPVDPAQETLQPEDAEPVVPPVPLDLETEFDENLPEWGPKVSPQQPDFEPVPPHRSGAGEQSETDETRPSAEAHEPQPQIQPHLWGEEDPVAKLLAEPKIQIEVQDQPTWTDLVPATPAVDRAD
ncbi:CapA family protein [Nodosilinea sp. LEGE 07088]|uniref:CapA family protein n=1 Tax=Nodosilinea sp. LEGE 07088 TaxID=2777968 RepID=UPI00187E236E|nr:CapA family protein [Nodosilinea sp. LEGE 07088]MBE9139251.1 CapA family protein [Nodosilinea sp. LEGE 07088]